MPTNSSFYNQNPVVGTATNPAGPAEAPVGANEGPSKSSFYGASGQPYADVQTIQATYADMLAADAAAAASAEQAATSETNAASSASGAAASKTAADTDAANALASANAAAISETNAAASASAASSSATNAAASKTAADTDAANALASANNSATSATAASTSATNAAASASAAATSASNAAASASFARRELLTADRTYYVRTDGSDSNTGLSNTSGAAWLTRQHAYDTICKLIDFGGFAVTVQVGPGTYTDGFVGAQPWTGGGSLTFLGDATTPSNVIVSTTNEDCFQSGAVLPGTLSINGFKLQTTTSGDCISMYGAGSLVFYNINFGACAGHHVLTGQPGATIYAGSNYTISGGAVCHVFPFNVSMIYISGVAVTLTGTPAFSDAFADVGNVSEFYCPSNTFTGSATGKRYSANTNSVIQTAGSGSTYLPGSVAGTTSTGGQYV